MKLTEEQRKIVEANIGLVPYTVNKYCSAWNMEYDDKISVGSVGLCRAACFFNPDKEKKFSTYAAKCIVNEIWKYHARSKRKKRGYKCTTVSLDSPLKDHYGNKIDDYTIADTVLDKDVDIENTVINKVICEPLWKFVPTFIATDKAGLTDRSYGLSLGLSTGTVNMRKKKEFKKIMYYMEAKGYCKADFI